MVYIYRKFQWQPLKIAETYAVNVKTWWECRKNKDGYLNIFKQYFLELRKVNSYENFSSRFHLFLCFCYYFEIEGIVLYDFNRVFYDFLPIPL